jgi:hypothetical protein
VAFHSIRELLYVADDLVAIPRGAIRDLIAGLSDFSTYWQGDAVMYEETYISLDIMAYTALGTDEQRQSYDASTDELGSLSCGLRLFTLSIRVDSYSMDLPGYEVCERIRRRLRAGAAREVMEDTGLALVRIHPITNLSVVADNRPVFCSVMDVVMSFAVNEQDSTPATGGDYIADAPTTGTLTDTVKNYPVVTT